MLGEALGRVRGLNGTAAEKADLFESLGGQITRQTDGGWSAARAAGADGSHIFAGGRGEALVIAPDGRIFRGNVNSPGQFLTGQGGSVTPIYDALRPLE